MSMFKSILSTLKSSASNDQNEIARRKFPRRENDRCVISIDNRNFPIANWSFGGVLLAGDDRLFGKDETIEFTIKFKLRDTVLNVDHTGKVVRTAPGKIAIEFDPISKMVRGHFRQVIDDHNAREFARSQA